VTPLGKSVPFASNGSVAPLAPDVPCVLRTIRALRDEEFDVVHLHEPLAPGPTWTAVLFSDAAMVGTYHRAGRSAAYQALRPLARWVAGRVAVNCAVSEDARRTVVQALGGDYELLFNGIDIVRFAKAEAWPTDSRTILFVGRHEPRKGLAVLLEAMARLPPDVHLWVASSGPETATLKARAADDPRVEWLGSLSDQELAQRLRGADVVCFPSLHGESFGVVLLEAMAAQTPIVASDIPGYRHVARDGQEALLVPPGDAPALANAVCRVLTDGALADRLVEAGDGRAADFSMERLAERYLELYEVALTR
jgi:phosphatidylinositol alpha-mannosyltransferase